MKQCEITFFNSKTHKIEIVYCKNIKITYPMHNHISNYVIGLLLNGEVKLTCADKQKIMHENDYFIISPYEPHMIEPICGKYTIMTVCISTKFINKYDLKAALPIFEALANFLLAKSLITQIQLAAFFSAIDLLFFNIGNTKKPLKTEITNAKNYLEQIFENTVSIEQLSKSFFISEYHFIREFKKSVGLTPHRFQIQNRIRKAQHLLTQNQNLAQVALATGFYDQSHFIKCFKKLIGVTPSQYLLSNCEISI